MEVLVLVVVLVVFLIGFYIKGAFDARTRKKNYRRKLLKEYGSNRENEKYPEHYQNLGGYAEKHQKDYSVDDITWHDLSMDRIFHRVNYTHSSCGEEYLYYRLRNPRMNAQEDCMADDEEALIRFFMEHSEERVNLQLMFTQMGHTGKYSLYQYLDFLDNLGARNNLKHILALLCYIPCAVLSFFQPSLGITAFIALMVYQIFSYLKERGEDEPYLVSFAFILRFIQGGTELCRILPKNCEGLSRLLDRKLKNLRSISKHSSLVAQENTQQGDPLSAIADYFKMITHLNLIQFNNILNSVRGHQGEIDELFTTLGYMEYLLCIGEYRTSLPEYCVPVLGSMKEYACEKLCHPLIDGAVPCSFTAKKGVLVTGSNASGKSTFLKNVALSAVLAQSMNTVSAHSYEACYFRIYSSMALQDDLTTGESYYMVEIRALKRIVDAAKVNEQNPVLCFVDEVLRGTNTVERIAASTQIMKYFCTLNALCFAATHDIELTHLLEQYYDNYHFEEEISEGDIYFNYELQSGRATTRNAIKLLEIMGYDAHIISEAGVIAENFIKTGTWELV